MVQVGGVYAGGEKMLFDKKVPWLIWKFIFQTPESLKKVTLLSVFPET